MVCIHGERFTPPNGQGKFFICRLSGWQYNGFQCPFSKICTLTDEYIASTDKKGQVCPNFDSNEI